MNPYIDCPIYETDSLILRLIKISDAEDLFLCYSDKSAVSRMNADYCLGGFYFTSVDQVKECIGFWLKEYDKGSFARLSIIDKKINKAVGTIEIFGGPYGVLRIDLASEYETENYINELISLAVKDLKKDFDVKILVTKVINSDIRGEVVNKLGFVLSKDFRPGLGYYEY